MITDAIALDSPNGRMSKRALKAAQERIRRKLFGDGLQVSLPAQPTKEDQLRREARDLRDLAARGLKPRAYLKRARELEAEADYCCPTCGGDDSTGCECPEAD